ncbi:MAG: cation-translocating P-type ATPase, partial [Actinomycetota bacterium]
MPADGDTTATFLRPSEEVTRELGVNPEQGLSDEEARRRLDRDGPNELRSAPPVPLWRRILAQFRDPLVSMLLAAIVISVAAWVVEGASGLPVDAIVIAVIVVLNAVIGLVEEAKAEDAVAALASMTAANSTVLRGGRLVTIPSAELVVGDVLVLSEGDAIGADARLVTATGLRIQEASLTGESSASEKDAATLTGKVALGDRHNMAYKGTAVVRGVGHAVVTATGMNTEMGAIAGLLESTESEPTPLQREIASVSKSLGIIVIAIAVVVMAAIALLNGVSSAEEAVTILLLGVSLAVAAVPEGLPAILSLVLAVGVRMLARRNAVMKSLHSVETLGSASVICSDKTGTLTRNEMTLRTVVTPLGRVDLDGVGYDPEGRARIGDTEDPGAAERAASRVLVTGALANNAQLAHDAEDGWMIEGDPTEAAFLVAVRKVDGAHERLDLYRRVAEIPFDSERKLMSTQVTHRNGHRRLFTKGAPDVLLERCTHVLVGDDVRPLDDAERDRILATVQDLSRQAFRTLAVAYRDLADDELTGDDAPGEDAERDLVHLGVVGIMDPPREEVADAIVDAHRAGIRTVMITGDHPLTALRIATDLGIVEPGARAISGTELDELTDEEFAEAAREVSVFARVAPEHKLRIVDALQADRHVVAMTGDGVNDAP